MGCAGFSNSECAKHTDGIQQFWGFGEVLVDQLKEQPLALGIKGRHPQIKGLIAVPFHPILKLFQSKLPMVADPLPESVLESLWVNDIEFRRLYDEEKIV